MSCRTPGCDGREAVVKSGGAVVSERPRVSGVTTAAQPDAASQARQLLRTVVWRGVGNVWLMCDHAKAGYDGYPISDCLRWNGERLHGQSHRHHRWRSRYRCRYCSVGRQAGISGWYKATNLDETAAQSVLERVRALALRAIAVRADVSVEDERSRCSTGWTPNWSWLRHW